MAAPVLETPSPSPPSKDKHFASPVQGDVGPWCAPQTHGQDALQDPHNGVGAGEETGHHRTDMLKRKLKLLISLGYFAASRSGQALRRLLGRPPAATAVILYYHAVKPHEREGFVRQMRMLKRLATPVRVDGTAAMAPGQHSVGVTFDDAFVSVAEQALPILNELAIPCTIFVPMAYLGRHPVWEQGVHYADRDETVMTAPQLRALPRDVVSLGSHTMTHPRLSECTEGKVRRELRLSRQALEIILGHRITLLALPHGAYTPQVLTCAREEGYRRIFTIEPGLLRPGDSQFVAGRVAVSPSDTPFEFRLKALGAYNWMPFASALKRGLRRALRRRKVI